MSKQKDKQHPNAGKHTVSLDTDIMKAYLVFFHDKAVSAMEGRTITYKCLSILTIQITPNTLGGNIMWNM